MFGICSLKSGICFSTQASVERRVEEDLLQWHLTMDMFRFRMEIISHSRMVCIDKYIILNTVGLNFVWICS